ncbi:hypothetical protein LSH36_1552g00000 [Paralvinella palmiformis]|uniref:Uncharacterized protein n=1 Tax=Paralvinella palmiformis TaxID=53620 RepID=A0AAD9IT87_9ANNE|nr:hypothetical protein LSH36_1552g00000 [Paralvinella palmiformis]
MTTDAVKRIFSGTFQTSIRERHSTPSGVVSDLQNNAARDFGVTSHPDIRMTSDMDVEVTLYVDNNSYITSRADIRPDITEWDLLTIEDESSGYLHPAALPVIVAVIVIVVIIIIVRMTFCIWKRSRRYRQEASRVTCDPDCDQNVVYANSDAYQQPPEYQECVNNPMYRKREDQEKMVDETPSICPPSYDMIQEGKYETLTVPEKSAMDRLRLQMRKTALAQPEPGTTALGRDNRCFETLSGDLDASVSVNRNGSCVLPKYNDLDHPPVYNNLSFCVDVDDEVNLDSTNQSYPDGLILARSSIQEDDRIIHGHNVQEVACSSYLEQVQRTSSAVSIQNESSPDLSAPGMLDINEVPEINNKRMEMKTKDKRVDNPEWRGSGHREHSSTAVLNDIRVYNPEPEKITESIPEDILECPNRMISLRYSYNKMIKSNSCGDLTVSTTDLTSRDSQDVLQNGRVASLSSYFRW